MGDISQNIVVPTEEAFIIEESWPDDYEEDAVCFPGLSSSKNFNNIMEMVANKQPDSLKYIGGEVLAWATPIQPQNNYREVVLS